MARLINDYAVYMIYHKKIQLVQHVFIVHSWKQPSRHLDLLYGETKRRPGTNEHPNETRNSPNVLRPTFN